MDDMSTTPIWRKSSLSGGNGGDCVELAVIKGDDPKPA